MGECLLEMEKEEAEALLEEKVEKYQEEQDANDAELEVIREKMAELKVQLYGRFGKSINLDD